MKPDILVFAASPSAAVMAQLEQHFVCHHVWQVSPDEQDGFIGKVAARVRGVLTVGTMGVSAALLERLPALEIISLNSVGYDGVDFDAVRRRNIPVTNTPGVLTDDVS